MGTIANANTATINITALVNPIGTYTNTTEVTASDNFDPDGQRRIVLDVADRADASDSRRFSFVVESSSNSSSLWRIPLLQPTLAVFAKLR